MALNGILRTIEGGRIVFWCPGCNSYHQVIVEGPGAWGFNRDYSNPSFHPSILVRSGHYVPEHAGPECWCTYNAKHPDDPAPFKCEICHSFVTDGQIQFLGDCTHELAGQTVPLGAPPASAG